MTINGEATVRAKSSDPMQPFVVLLGTPLQFSDQMLRILRLEFSGVRFERICNPDEVLGLAICPSVVVLHEGVPNLESLINGIRSTFPEAMLAVACSDPALLRATCQMDSLPPVSLLQFNTQLDVWLSVLRLLLCGHAYVPVDVAPLPRVTPAAPAPQAAAVRAPDAQLTPRELQILPLIAQGMQNKTIAGELGLSEHTVKLHTHNIYTKLKVSNRTGAANWFLSQVEGAGNVGFDSHAK